MQASVVRRLIEQEPLRDIKTGLWCAVSATRIIRPNFISDTTHSEGHHGQILAPLFRNWSNKEKEYRFFQQDIATVHSFPWSNEIIYENNPPTRTTLTLYLLTWRIWWAPNNASNGKMGFNLAFKGLNTLLCVEVLEISRQDFTQFLVWSRGVWDV